MRFRRVVVAVPAALVAVLLLAAPAHAESGVTVEVHGLEYFASVTEGRFGGTASGPVAGVWRATVVHDPLRRGAAVPITGGSFSVRSGRGDLRGTFVGGTVRPLGRPTTCGPERFAVDGALASPDGDGSFRVTLTHLRTRTDDGCRTYGAVVTGSMTVPAAAAV